MKSRFTKYGSLTKYGSFLTVYVLFLTIYVTLPAGLFPACAYSRDRVILTMEDCRRMAAENNNAVRNSRLDVTAAKARRGEALAEYFPQVSLNAFGFHAIDPMLRIGLKDILGNSDAAHEITSNLNDLARQRGINTEYSTLWHGYGASVSLIQPVFAGGRIVSGNRLASLGVQAAELQFSLQQRKSAEQIEEQYWQVVSLQEKMKTVEQVQTLLDTLQKDINAAVAAGVAVESDKLQVRLKMNELSSTRTKLRGGIRLAKMNLCNSIGQEYTPYSTIGTDSLPHIDSILLVSTVGRLDEPMSYYRDEEEIVDLREENRLLEISVDAKKLEKRMVLGEVLPQIGIGGTYGYGAVIGEGRFNGALFATLKIPVTEWGKYSRKLQRYECDVQKAINDRDYLHGQLLLQAREQWLDLVTCWEQIEVAEDGVEIASTSVRELSSRYKEGLVPLSDLLAAQTRLRQCTDTLTDARIAYCKALVRYRTDK